MDAAKVKTLLKQVPELDAKDAEIPNLKTKPSPGKLTGPPWEQAVAIFDPLLEGGPGALTAVIDRLQEVDDGSDYRARYVLHGLAQYVCRPDKTEQQQMLAGVLASEIVGKRAKPIREFLVRQLQVCGRRPATAALGKLVGEAELCLPACEALTAIGDGAAEQLRQALGQVKGRCRAATIQALGVLGDGASAAALREALAEQDAAVRLAAAEALANLGDATAADALLAAAEKASGWERIRLNEACLRLGTRLCAAGDKAAARTVYTRLKDTRQTKGEAHIRRAAERALAEM